MAVTRTGVNEMIKSHQWTHNGKEVLVLRFVDSEGKSYGGFQHPLKVGETVIAPDWNDRAECGGGIHGWPWGLSMGDGKNADWSAKWQVYGVNPADIVDLSGKCKFRTGVLRFIGDWHAAMLFVLDGQIALVQHRSRGAASATGSRGAASATGSRGASSATGWRGAASATGWRGAASATGWMGASSATGERGAASATGWSGAASATGWMGASSATGESGAASATGWKGAASATGSRGAASATGESGAASATGWSGAASATGWSGAASATGECSAAVVTSLNGRAKCGENGCIALAFWNAKRKCNEMRVAGTRTGRLKPHIWYRLDDRGRFYEDPVQS